MPKIRILSGNQAGAIVEMERTLAEVSVSTGYAEYVIEESAPAKVSKRTTLPSRVSETESDS
jgi:hypothetical protein